MSMTIKFTGFEFTAALLYFLSAVLALELRARDHVISLLALLLLLLVLSITRLYRAYTVMEFPSAAVHAVALICVTTLLTASPATKINVFSTLMQIRGYITRPLFASHCATSALVLSDGSKIGICEFGRAVTHAYVFDDRMQLFTKKDLRSDPWKFATARPGPLHIFEICAVEPRRIGGSFVYVDINCYNSQ
jgi:hypothetical protein